jgi:invasion protein IalB
MIMGGSRLAIGPGSRVELLKRRHLLRRILQSTVRLGALAVFLGSSMVPSLAEDAAPSALSETYGDWVVSCATVQAADKKDSERKSACQMSQELRQGQSGKRALLILFGIDATDKTLLSGTVVAPFGLDLKSGLTLRISDNVHLEAPFKTCFPQGCVAPVGADSKFQAAMRTGEKLTVVMKAADSGQAVNMDVSLKGFGQAHDRLTTLSAKNK